MFQPWRSSLVVAGLCLLNAIQSFVVAPARRPHGLLSPSLQATSSPNHLTIEYCTGCRWTARAMWMTQELLTTFNENDNLNAITVIPSRPPPGARFVVSLFREGETLLWDRQAQEGFPEVKQLKQLVRDNIDPDLFLGHSDNKEGQEGSASEEEEEEESTALSSAQVMAEVLEKVKQPNVAIQYCTGCRWMLRSAYFGTEILATFSEEINSFTLIPSRPPGKGGVFTVTVNGQVVWDRAEQGGFPEVKELKQIVRDVLVPTKDLGHSDRKDREKREHDDDEMDDDDAAEMRSYYGVI